MKAKLLLWMFVFLILASSVYSNYSINFYENGQVGENLTFWNEQNLTRYVRIPLHANLTNATLTVENNSDRLCVHNNNSLNICQNTNNYTFYSDNTATRVWIDYNYSVPSNATSASRIRFKIGDNQTDAPIPSDCWDSTLIMFSVTQLWSGGDVATTFTCENVTNANNITIFTNTSTAVDTGNCDGVKPAHDTNYSLGMIHADGAGNRCDCVEGGSCFYEKSMVWYYNVAIDPEYPLQPLDPYLYIGQPEGDNDWNVSGNMTTSTQINFTDKLNTVTDTDNCNCSDCTLTDDSCTVPLLFFSNRSSIINTYLLNISYRYTMNILIRDEITNELITSGVEVDIISNTFTVNYTTSTGNDSIDLLPETYQIRYNGSDYPRRFYNFQLTNETNSTITLYLLNASAGATNVTATVYNEIPAKQEGVLIRYYKYDLDTNSYVLVGSDITNSQGEARLYIILNDENYLFRLYYPIDTLREESAGEIIRNENLAFYINTRDEIGETFYNVNDIVYTFNFNNDTNNFIFTYTDVNELGSNYCVEVFDYKPLTKTQVNSSCSTSFSNTITLGVEVVNGTTYVANAYVTIEGVDYYIDTTSYTYGISNVFKESDLGLFVILAITLVFVFISLRYVVALLFAPLPLVFGSFMGIINIPMGYIVGLIILSVTAMLLLKRST